MNSKNNITERFPDGYFFQKLAEYHKLRSGKLPLKTQTIFHKSDKSQPNFILFLM